MERLFSNKSLLSDECCILLHTEQLFSMSFARRRDVALRPFSSCTPSRVPTGAYLITRRLSSFYHGGRISALRLLGGMTSQPMPRISAGTRRKYARKTFPLCVQPVRRLINWVKAQLNRECRALQSHLVDGRGIF